MKASARTPRFSPSVPIAHTVMSPSGALAGCATRSPPAVTLPLARQTADTANAATPSELSVRFMWTPSSMKRRAHPTRCTAADGFPEKGRLKPRRSARDGRHEGVDEAVVAGGDARPGGRRRRAHGDRGRARRRPRCCDRRRSRCSRPPPPPAASGRRCRRRAPAPSTTTPVSSRPSRRAAAAIAAHPATSATPSTFHTSTSTPASWICSMAATTRPGRTFTSSSSSLASRPLLRVVRREQLEQEPCRAGGAGIADLAQTVELGGDLGAVTVGAMADEHLHVRRRVGGQSLAPVVVFQLEDRQSAALEGQGDGDTGSPGDVDGGAAVVVVDEDAEVADRRRSCGGRWRRRRAPRRRAPWLR